MSLIIIRICQCRDISNKSKRDKTNLQNIEIQIPELHKSKTYIYLGHK